MSEEYVLIGAGLPRTGTSSMREALKQILDGKCYHMLTLVNDDNKEREHAKFWNVAIKRRLSPQDWRDFFTKHSIKASVDYPASLIPPIILDSAFQLYCEHFIFQLGNIMLLAVVGSIINIFMIGIIIYGTIGIFNELTILECIMLSSTLSAVDSVAVLALMSQISNWSEEKNLLPNFWGILV